MGALYGFTGNRTKVYWQFKFTRFHPGVRANKKAAKALAFKIKEIM
jgi:hypothetical protein